MRDKKIANIVMAWFLAFNEHNLENLIALYAEDAEHYSPKLKLRKPETNGLIKGKDALRLWWKDSFERLPSLYYSPQQFIFEDSNVFIAYTRSVKGEETMLAGETLEIKDGLIVASRVYHS